MAFRGKDGHLYVGYPVWKMCLLKPGAEVLVDVNYSGEGSPNWQAGTLISVHQFGRLCKVDVVAGTYWVGVGNHIAARVKRTP